MNFDFKKCCMKILLILVTEVFGAQLPGRVVEGPCHQGPCRSRARAILLGGGCTLVWQEGLGSSSCDVETPELGTHLASSAEVSILNIFNTWGHRSV